MVTINLEWAGSGTRIATLQVDNAFPSILDMQTTVHGLLHQAGIKIRADCCVRLFAGHNGLELTERPVALSEVHAQCTRTPWLTNTRCIEWLKLLRTTDADVVLAVAEYTHESNNDILLVDDMYQQRVHKRMLKRCGCDAARS
jgi:hypothetical protein